MSDKDKNEQVYDDGTYVVKKSKRTGVIALIVCLMIALIIWCYSKGSAMIKDAVSDNVEGDGKGQVADTVADTTNEAGSENDK